MTAATDDIWGAPETDVPEPPKLNTDLPDKATVILETLDGTAKETVQPKIKVFQRKDGSGDFIMLKLAARVIGGDANIKANHVGRYLFKDFNVEKPTAEQLEERMAKLEPGSGGFNRLKGQLSVIDKFPCDPELYNLILDTLAPEGKTTAERWAVAKARLGEQAKADGLTLAGAKGSTEILYGNAFCAVLKAGSVRLIGSTYTPKQKNPQYAPQQTFGSIGSFTDAEATRRKVKVIQKEEEGF